MIGAFLTASGQEMINWHPADMPPSLAVQMNHQFLSIPYIQEFVYFIQSGEDLATKPRENKLFVLL